MIYAPAALGLTGLLLGWPLGAAVGSQATREPIPAGLVDPTPRLP